MKHLIIGFLFLFWLSPALAVENPPPEPPASPAPYKVPIYNIPQNLTLCGEPVPLNIQAVYEMLDREFQLAVYDHAQVVMWLKRANRYFPAIERALSKAGMPDDLKYLAVAESALKIYAYSSAGAAGVWQFVSSTGRRYGLSRGKHQDERLDFDSATKAALTYLKDLHDMFGSWALAMAAYNCGEQRVEREIAKQGVNNYYLLNLPLETERYLFRIMSAKLILSDPEKYGYDVSKIRLYDPLDTKTVSVRTSKSVHLRDVAKAAKSYFKEIKELNPSRRGDYLPPGIHWLRIPAKGANGFQSRLAALMSSPSQAKASTKKAATSSKRVYVVRKGDNLSQISRKLGVSVKTLMRKNNLRTSKITVGQKLAY